MKCRMVARHSGFGQTGPLNRGDGKWSGERFEMNWAGGGDWNVFQTPPSFEPLLIRSNISASVC